MEEHSHILVVDDQPNNRLVVRRILEEVHFRVSEAANGWEAVETALRELPDVILMDIRMPVMDGLTAIQRLMMNEKTQRIPILVLTGTAEREERLRALDLGAMDCVTKPFDRAELVAHVKTYSRLSRLNRRYVLSTMDAQTGLPNKAALLESLESASSPRLFLVRIDNLEMLNRCYGARIAAQVEIRLARFLPSFVAEKIPLESRVYSFRDGIFAILVEDETGMMGRNGAVRICELMDRSLKALKVQVEEHEFDVEASIGVSLGGSEMLAHAHLALELAKRERVGHVVADDVYAKAQKDVERNILCLKGIRSALAAERVVPFFQPIQCNQSGRITKYEALVRIQKEDGNLLLPGEFLNIAKQSRYYLEMTRLLFRRTMDVFRSRTEEVCVNLSALDIESEDTRAWILAEIQRDPQLSRRLILELVEEENVKSFQIIRKFIEDVKAHGVKIAIDDFGSGYSNFTRILDLNVDFVKIDGSLIRKICEDTRCRQVVTMMSLLARNTGLQVVAEFVENEAIQAEVVKMGIQFSQGYFIGRASRFPVDSPS